MFFQKKCIQLLQVSAVSKPYYQLHSNPKFEQVMNIITPFFCLQQTGHFSLAMNLLLC